MTTSTDSTETEPVPDAIDSLVGERVHFLASGSNLDTSPAGSNYWEPMFRGREVTLTATIIASTRDRLGRSWLELLDDEAAQLERWRRLTVARGPWPEGLDKLDPELTMSTRSGPTLTA